MYHEDLSPATRKNHVYVGWLDEQHEYSKAGEVPAKFAGKFVAKLYELARHGTVRQTRGFHPCPFCDKEHGSAEIEVSHNGVTFEAPSLIAHYVGVHDYVPPGQFIKAILES